MFKLRLFCDVSCLKKPKESTIIGYPHFNDIGRPQLYICDFKFCQEVASAHGIKQSPQLPFPARLRN